MGGGWNGEEFRGKGCCYFQYAVLLKIQIFIVTLTFVTKFPSN